MRGAIPILLTPVALLMVAGGGLLACRMMGVDPQVRAMIIALIGSLAATAVAASPVFLTMNSTQAGVAQAGLISTALHLMGHAVAAGIVLVGRLPVSGGFIYWLMAFYFVSLILLSAWLVRVIRRAPIDNATTVTGSGKQ
jgi:hypothetical protein